MTTLRPVSPFAGADVDAVADAMLEASHPIHTTPPRSLHTPNHRQHLVTFTPSGLATPARISQNAFNFSPSNNIHMSQQQLNQQQITPLKESVPHNSNITSSAARPPLPHQKDFHNHQGGTNHLVIRDDDSNNLPNPDSSPKQFNVYFSNFKSNASPTSTESTNPSQSSSESRPPPLTQINSLLTAATPQPYYKPIVDPANNSPVVFSESSHIVQTPSDLFSKFDPLSSIRTPLHFKNHSPSTATAQISFSPSFSPHAIPLTFSAANTPLPYARGSSSSSASPFASSASNIALKAITYEHSSSDSSSPTAAKSAKTISSSRSIDTTCTKSETKHSSEIKTNESKASKKDEMIPSPGGGGGEDEHDPNPEAMVSFFRQRSARLSSPIFNILKTSCANGNGTILSSPVVRANPLAQSDIAAAAIPPKITPIHVADIEFSLNNGFGFEGMVEGVDMIKADLDLGIRAARIPLPYAIRLRLVDEKGPIRPIAARIQRSLGGPQSMFLSVIDSNEKNPCNLIFGSSNDSGSNNEPNDLQSLVQMAGTGITCNNNNNGDVEMYYLFWAAPDAFSTHGSGRLLFSVTDDEYMDYEIPIDLSVQSTRPSISVEAPGYPCRQVRAETNITFSEHDLHKDVLISVWNETDGEAPLLLNIVLEEDAGGAFSIGEDSTERAQCIPVLIKAGCSQAFRARFCMRPELTLRKRYYGSVVIKYAFIVQGKSRPGHDLELNQYYDHVVNLTASIDIDAVNEISENDHGRHSHDSIRAEALVLSSWSDDVCNCSDADEHPTAGCSTLEVDQNVGDKMNDDVTDHAQEQDELSTVDIEDGVHLLKQNYSEYSQIDTLCDGDNSEKEGGVEEGNGVHVSNTEQDDGVNDSESEIEKNCSQNLDESDSINNISEKHSENTPQSQISVESHNADDIQGNVEISVRYENGSAEIEDYEEEERKREQHEELVDDYNEYDEYDNDSVASSDDSHADKSQIQDEGIVASIAPTDLSVGDKNRLVLTDESADEENVINGSQLSSRNEFSSCREPEIVESECIEYEEDKGDMSNNDVQNNDLYLNDEDENSLPLLSAQVQIDSAPIYLHSVEEFCPADDLELLANCADVETKVTDTEAQLAEDDDADDNDNVESVFPLLAQENDNEEQQEEHQNNIHEFSSFENEDVEPHSQSVMESYGTGAELVSSDQDYSQDYVDRDEERNGILSSSFSLQGRQESNTNYTDIPHDDVLDENDRPDFVDEYDQDDVGRQEEIENEREERVGDDELMNLVNEAIREASLRVNEIENAQEINEEQERVTPLRNLPSGDLSNDDSFLRSDHEISSEQQGIEVSSSELIQPQQQQSTCEEDENIEADQNVAIEALASLHQFCDTGLHRSTSMDDSTTLTETIPGTGRRVSLWKGSVLAVDWKANDEASNSVEAHLSQHQDEQSNQSVDKNVGCYINNGSTSEPSNRSDSNSTAQDGLGSNVDDTQKNQDDTAHTGVDENTTALRTKAGKPKLKMPRRIRNNGVIIGENQGSIELPVLNASTEVVEVSIAMEPFQRENGTHRHMANEGNDRSKDIINTRVSPSYVVIGVGEKAIITMERTSSSSSESLIVLHAATLSSEGEKGRTSYKIPTCVEKSIMCMEPSQEFSVDRPTMSFYNPSNEGNDTTNKEWSVRLRNGTLKAAKFKVWISEGGGKLTNSNDEDAFKIMGCSHSIIQPERFSKISVMFNGDDGERIGHYHGRLNIRIGGQRDFMPLFGYSGTSNIQLQSTELGYICAKNIGNRYGFIIITSPEKLNEYDSIDVESVKSVLGPGEEREFMSPYGTGSIIYTGDEIARSRKLKSEELMNNNINNNGDGYGIFDGEFDGEQSAYEQECYDWFAEDKFSMFYAGRLLDYNMKRYAYNPNNMGFIETNGVNQRGWTACVDADGIVHVENLQVKKEVNFQVEGAEPSCGVIAPMGDAMLAAFRETVEIRAQGRTEILQVQIPSRVY